MFLETKHPKFEYTCYVQVKNACPYIGIWRGESIADVYRDILQIEKRHNRYKQHFYIDNDFYENIYKNNDFVYYYRFMYRQVNDWKTLELHSNTNKLQNDLLQLCYKTEE